MVISYTETRPEPPKRVQLARRSPTYLIAEMAVLVFVTVCLIGVVRRGGAADCLAFCLPVAGVNWLAVFRARSADRCS